MIIHLSRLFGGPVFFREFRRVTGGGLPLRLRTVYAVFLFVLLLSTMGRTYSARLDRIRGPLPGETVAADLSAPWRPHQPRYFVFVSNAQDYVSLLLHQQLLLMVLCTPLLTAAAIVYEKQADTLEALFGTDLGPIEIVTGKLLGRLAPLGIAATVATPLLVLMAVLADISVINVCLAFVQAAVLACALGAMCLLVFFQSRRPVDAILGSYVVMFGCWLLVVAVEPFFHVPEVLDPLPILEGLAQPHVGSQALPALWHLALYTAVGTVCLAGTAMRLKAWTLRPTSGRRIRSFRTPRPPVGDKPVRWRERYVRPLAPLPVLHFVPRWLIRFGLFCFFAFLAGLGIDKASGGFVMFWLGQGKVINALQYVRYPCDRLDWVSGYINLAGLVLVGVGSIAAAVRGAESITEEVRCKTWEDLILTPLTWNEILSQKYAGLLRAVTFPVALYGLPLVALGAQARWSGVLLVIAWVVGACFATALAGLGGIVVAVDSVKKKEIDSSRRTVADVDAPDSQRPRERVCKEKSTVRPA
jgi:hypothetical protein